MSFLKWLRARRNDRNKIGDIATDILEDHRYCEAGDFPRRPTLKNLRLHITTSHDACDAAIAALECAWEEYKTHDEGN